MPALAAKAAYGMFSDMQLDPRVKNTVKKRTEPVREAVLEFVGYF